MNKMNKNSPFKNVQVIEGSVVIVPPEDQATPSEEQSSTIIAPSNGSVMVKVEGDQDVSQVSDAETELLSNAAASQIKEENAKAHREARFAVEARRAGNSVVTAGTFNDIDLPEYDQQAKQQAAQVQSELETSRQAQKALDKKKASAEDVFQAALQDALNEQSEEFVESYEED